MYAYVYVKNLKVYQFFLYLCVSTKNGGKMEHKIYGELRVAQYSKKGHLLRIWNSQTEASEATRIARQAISMCCNGKIKTAGGYRWSFI